MSLLIRRKGKGSGGEADIYFSCGMNEQTKTKYKEGAGR